MHRSRFSVVVLLSTAVAALVVSSALALDINVEKQPPPGEVNTPYEFKFEAEGGCMQSWYTTYSSGRVPPGLQITRDLRLVGTPTEAGEWEFYVEIADEGCPAKSLPSQELFGMTVLPDLRVKTDTVPLATVGTPYSFMLEYEGFNGGWDEPRWRIKEGALPAGLTLAPTGLVSGTPTAEGESTAVVRIEEPFRRSGEKQLTFTVAFTLTASVPTPAPGEVGVPYALRPTSSGGVKPVVWSVGAAPLPPGLSLDPATGAVTGTPSRAATYPVTLEVKDRVGTSKRMTVLISVAPKLQIVTRGVVPVPRGQRVAIKVAKTGGVAPVTYSVAKGSLPSGLRLVARTGTIVGRAGTPGRYPVTLRARDSLGAVATSRLVLRVR